MTIIDRPLPSLARALTQRYPGVTIVQCGRCAPWAGVSGNSIHFRGPMGLLRRYGLVDQRQLDAEWLPASRARRNGQNLRATDLGMRRHVVSSRTHDKPSLADDAQIDVFHFDIETQPSLFDGHIWTRARTREVEGMLRRAIGATNPRRGPRFSLAGEAVGRIS